MQLSLRPTRYHIATNVVLTGGGAAVFLLSLYAAQVVDGSYQTPAYIVAFSAVVAACIPFLKWYEERDRIRRADRLEKERLERADRWELAEHERRVELEKLHVSYQEVIELRDKLEEVQTKINVAAARCTVNAAAPPCGLPGCGKRGAEGTES